MLTLCVRASDYGMTEGITDGCLKAVRDGILKDVGLMTNNPSAERAAEEIKKYPWVCVGQDLNLFSGWPVTDPKLIPTLVNKEGRLLSSRERKEQNCLDRLDYDEVILEMENQIKKFIKLMGRAPIYLAGHSLEPEVVKKAIRTLCEKYKAVDYSDLYKYFGENWYMKNVKVDPKDPKPFYDLNAQAQTDVVDFIIHDKCKILNREFAILDTHCGFCDGDLLDMSTVSVVRGKEAQAFCSPLLKQWIEENHIRMVTLEQFIKEIAE